MALNPNSANPLMHKTPSLHSGIRTPPCFSSLATLRHTPFQVDQCPPLYGLVFCEVTLIFQHHDNTPFSLVHCDYTSLFAASAMANSVIDSRLLALPRELRDEICTWTDTFATPSHVEFLSSFGRLQAHSRVAEKRYVIALVPILVFQMTES